MNAAQQSISMPVFLDINLNCPMLSYIVLSLPLGLRHYLLDPLACNDEVGDAAGLVDVLSMQKKS
jgi:hypothetical protein